VVRLSDDSGIIGDGLVNLMYFGVFAVGFIGAFISRFQPRGMSRALFATAAAQALVPLIAMIWLPAIDFSWGLAPRWVSMRSSSRCGSGRPAVSESSGWGGRTGCGIARTKQSTASERSTNSLRLNRRLSPRKRARVYRSATPLSPTGFSCSANAAVFGAGLSGGDAASPPASLIAISPNAHTSVKTPGGLRDDSASMEGPPHVKFPGERPNKSGCSVRHR
jgi:hypothetical protein